MFLEYILIFCSVIFIVKISTPLFIKRKWLDNSGARKKHIGSVPVNGGISMFIGFFIGFAFFNNVYDNFLILFICSSLVLTLGFLDDISDLSAQSRMLAQTMVILIAYSFGMVQINSFGNIFGNGLFSFNDWSLIITLLAFMAGMNAQNLVDGIDGLSSGTAIVTISSITFLALNAQMNQIAIISFIYLSILIPFFYLNLSINKIFMGDSGSLFIGFGIAWLLIISAQGELAFFKPITALWIYALPLLDIISVIIIRLKSRKSPFQPDHSHIHNQIMLKLEISSRKALVFILLTSVLFAVIGVTMEISNTPEWLMFGLLMAIFLLYTIFIITYQDKKSLSI
ncbi:hypothetical protein [Candidatus Pseudothioglobus sp. Uisw_086]|uniref:hypothetical protein n=1 Tax=Candidatus Pseudothioglobus sp. Uisw_086 TaxID=3230998 RepID=UPI003A8A46E6